MVYLVHILHLKIYQTHRHRTAEKMHFITSLLPLETSSQPILHFSRWNPPGLHTSWLWGNRMQVLALIIVSSSPDTLTAAATLSAGSCQQFCRWMCAAGFLPTLNLRGYIQPTEAQKNSSRNFSTRSGWQGTVEQFVAALNRHDVI